MTTTRERAARRLCFRSCHESDPCRTRPQGCTSWHGALGDVDAVLEEIREPTFREGLAGAYKDSALDTWRAMIDAIKRGEG